MKVILLVITHLNHYGIYNDSGTITTIENYGTISANASSPDIYNRNGTIGTLINRQGGSDALSYKGAAPTNYEIVISGSTNYGKLQGFGLTDTLNFSINEDSDLTFGGSDYTEYDSTDTLNPTAGTAYFINSDQAITVVVDAHSTVTGPNHNLFIDDADSLSITIDRGVVYKNEGGAVNSNSYTNVLQNVLPLSIASLTGTNNLDGTDVNWELTNTGSNNWDLEVAGGGSDQSGQVIHVDNESLTNITIANSGTVWSTENTAIEFDGTTITGTATLTNIDLGTVASGSTTTDEAAIKIQDTTGTINITNNGLITSATQGILNTNSIINTIINGSTGILEATSEGSQADQYAGLKNAESSTITTLTNEGLIQANQIFGVGLRNDGTFTQISNTDQIIGKRGLLNNNTGVISNLTNSDTGIISGSNSMGLRNNGTVGWLRNDGIIRSLSSKENKYGLLNANTITNLINSGQISSTGDDAINNTGTISNLVNTGDINGVAGAFDINNTSGSITNIFNNQGFVASSDPLTLTGNLPTNYYVHIDSTSDYGQLAVTSGVGNINFRITPGSVIGIPTVNYNTYSTEGVTLNPGDGTPYKIDAIGKDITVVADGDWTVTGPVHNILVDEAESFNLTINAGITAKNEAGSIAGATYSSVLSGVSSSQITSETSQTVDLDGTDVTFTLAETSTSGTWDLSTNAVSNQSGQIVHIDNTSIQDVTITNNGTMWSTENNAIEMDGTDITGTATITNNTDATIRSDSTSVDEAAIAIKDTIGTVVIANAGTMTGPNGLLVDNSIVTFNNTGTVNATVGEALLLKNNAFVNLTNTGTMSGIKGININGTTPTISNTGTVTSSGNDNAAVYNTDTLTNLNNTGTLQGTGASNSYGLYSEGSIARTENSGSIISTNSSGLYNSGTVNELINRTGSGIISSTNSHGLQNDGTITWLINSGSISTSSTSSYGVYNTSPNTIVNFVNEGSIASNSDGVNNTPGAITNFENAGTISSGAGFFDINNIRGSITNLYNNQGAATSDPLTFIGNLPTNYFITIDRYIRLWSTCRDEWGG